MAVNVFFKKKMKGLSGKNKEREDIHKRSQWILGH